MTFLETILLGTIEGITEFLPISSTAHIDFARYFLGISVSDFIKSYEIIIQFGAILAVLIIYFKKIFFSFTYFRNILIAFIPTGIIGFLLYQVIKGFLLTKVFLAAIMLVLGGGVILYFEKRKKQLAPLPKEKIEDLSFKELFLLGLAQALAIIPGISRSGAVIIAGRSMQLNRNLITEFSFLLAIPTMFFASFYDLLKSGFNFKQDEWGILAIGFIVSFLVAFLVVKWLIHYIQNHSFEIFGWYRIIFGTIILVLLIFN